MNRRKFFTTTSKLGIIMGGGLIFTETYNRLQEMTLPSIDGDFNIILPEEKIDFIQTAQASYNVTNQYAYYQYNANQRRLMMEQFAYQQRLAYQQAWQAWRQQLLAYQQQQYRWIRDQQITALQNAMKYYKHYQISNPRPWESIRSIYGAAQNKRNVTLFGVNNSSEPVAIQKTVKGASSVFKDINNYYSEQQAEQAVGPQSFEERTLITLPNGSQLTGNSYTTDSGYLAVSDKKVTETKTGKTGNLVKYVMHNGEKYKVV